MLVTKQSSPPKSFFFKDILLKRYLFILAVLGFTTALGLSPVAASRDYSLVGVLGLLLVVASLVAERGL